LTSNCRAGSAVAGVDSTLRDPVAVMNVRKPLGHFSQVYLNAK
jgi:hypothetical protein